LSRSSGRSFALGLGIGLAIAAGLWWYLQKGPGSITPPPPPGGGLTYPEDPARASNRLVEAIHEGLSHNDLLKLLERPVESVLVEAGGRQARAYRETYRLPRRWTAEQVIQKLRPVAEEAEGRFVEGRWQDDAEGRAYVAVFGFSGGWNPVTVVLLDLKAPRLALVLDDGGYNKGRDLSAMWALKVPATVAVIPGLEFSTLTARLAPENGWEVICHMPMEGHEYTAPETYKWFLKRNATPEELTRILTGALSELPDCRGMNNHMGSHATEEKDLMLQTAHFLRERGLFFLDSRTSDKTVARMTMRQAGVPSMERHVFLDNSSSEDAIRRQVRLAVAKARKKGYAVAIGHVRYPTLKALAKALPEVRSSGVKLVYLSELVD
jgi:polysaccharide deacetylase 2 family uncharacterized protein YibQ